MRIVGLTGGIASGKTSVCKILKEQSVPVISCDAIAREVVEQGCSGYIKVIKQFGQEILLPSGEIDREKLGSLIFNNEDNRKLLNKCIHPEIAKVVRKQLLWHFLKGTSLIVVDIPLLYETKGLSKYFSSIIVVYCTEKQQAERLIDREEYTEEEASVRINSQMSLQEKKKLANHVIDNSGLFSDTEVQVRDLIPNLRSGIWPVRELVGASLVAVVSLSLFFF